MHTPTKRSFAIVALGLTLLTSGCASQQKLADYQDEVRALREERTQLKKENRELRAANQDYEVRLSEASQKLNSVKDTPQYGELDALGIEYRNQGNDFVISIPSSITFASGKASLTKGGREALAAVARTLSKDYADGTYWIEGHTDSDPIKKSKWESNRALSVARAMAVLRALVEENGIPDEKCVVAGHGEYEPVAPNDTKSGKAQNRRVEIVVHR